MGRKALNLRRQGSGVGSQAHDRELHSSGKLTPDP